MPVASEPPAEGEASINSAPPPQPLEISMSQGNLNAFPSQVEIGNDSISLNSGENAGNWVSEAPAAACGEDESILGDFIGVSSLEHVDIFKLGLPPLNFLTEGIVFALFQVCEYSCGTGDGKKAEAAHTTIKALQTGSQGCTTFSDDFCTF
jgi:hypothetical protein